MKKAFAFSVLSLFLAQNAHADEWADFSKFMDNFYLLDKTSLKSVTCGIEVSSVKPMLEQFKSLPKGIAIADHSGDFRMVYTKGAPIKFENIPTLDMNIVSEEGIANKEQVQSGIKTTKAGYDMVFRGAMSVIQGVFHEYTAPKQEEFGNAHFTQSGKNATLSFEREGAKFEFAYDSDKRRTHSEMKGMSAKSEDTFTKVDGKSAFTSSNQILNMGTGHHKTKSEVTFQKLKNASFPSTITSEVESENSGTQMKGKVEIALKDCKAE